MSDELKKHCGLVRDIYAAKVAARKPVISFEFFPPKTEEGDRNLLDKYAMAFQNASLLTGA